MKTYRNIWFALATAWAAFHPTMLWSQGGVENIDTTKIKDFAIDLAPPDLGAVTLLGVKPANISRPGNVKELAAEILNIAQFSEKSVLPGIAVEWAPYQTFSKVSNQKFINYKKIAPWRNIQASFATSEDTTGIGLAYGLKWSIDKSDPLGDRRLQQDVIAMLGELSKYDPQGFDFLKELRDMVSELASAVENSDLRTSAPGQFRAQLQNLVINPFLDGSTTEGGDDESPTAKTPDLKRMSFSVDSLLKASANDVIDDWKRKRDAIIDFVQITQTKSLVFRMGGLLTYEERFKKYLENYRKKAWNRFAMSIGAGHVLRSEDGLWKNMGNERISGFVNVSIPVIGKFNGIVEQGKVQAQLVLLAKADKFIGSDSGALGASSFLGGRFILGNNDVRISAEGSFMSQDTVELGTTQSVKAALGLELRAQEGMWLQLGFGLDKPIDELRGSQLIGMGTFRYAINTKPKIKFE